MARCPRGVALFLCAFGAQVRWRRPGGPLHRPTPPPRIPIYGISNQMANRQKKSATETVALKKF
ncbi:hypothetical protein Y030_5697 [Burkholderia pseudomallei MSHR332]|nr:hypothetical protein Y030_5697 [Burkholderia pseudomallei MSHR332]